MKTQTEARQLPAAAELQQHVANEVAAEKQNLQTILATTEQVATLAAAKVVAVTAAAHRVIEEQETQAADWFEVSCEKDFYSTGKACELLGLSPPQLRAAMKAAGVRFAERRNDVPYLNGIGIVDLARHLKAIREPQAK